MSRDLKLLIQKYQFDVAALEQSTLSGLSHDERSEIIDVNLLCLRFILSADSISKASSNLASFIAWRFRSEAGSRLYVCLKQGTQPQNWEIMMAYACMGLHGQSLDGDYLLVIRAGLSNGKALMKALTHDQVVELMLFNRARMIDICDRETVRTGRLTKAITVNDLSHTSISRMSSPFNNALAATAKLSEVYFPQLLDTAVLIHMPSAIRLIFSTIKRLLPAKVQAKIRVCAAQKGHSISKCPWASSHLALATLPTFLGGECSCPHSGGCIAGTHNDQRVANLADSDDGLKSWTISRGKRYDIFASIHEPGSTIIWQVQVEKGTLSSGGLTIEAVLRPIDTSEHPPEVLKMIEKRTIKADQGLVSGEVVLPHTGTFIFTLTNTSSVWSRSVKYSVEIITSRGEIEAEGDLSGQESEDNTQHLNG